MEAGRIDNRFMKFDIELDARQLACPLPILRVKQSLSQMTSGQVIRVVATDKGAPKDLENSAVRQAMCCCALQRLTVNLYFSASPLIFTNPAWYVASLVVPTSRCTLPCACVPVPQLPQVRDLRSWRWITGPAY